MYWSTRGGIIKNYKFFQILSKQTINKNGNTPSTCNKIICLYLFENGLQNDYFIIKVKKINFKNKTLISDSKFKKIEIIDIRFKFFYRLLSTKLYSKILM